MTVSGQRLGKFVPVATNMHATMELLLKWGFSAWSVPRYYKQGTEFEARHRKYKRLKLGSGQTYDNSSD
jgi:hypothetical protein